MKKLTALAFVFAAIFKANSDSVPETAVVVSTETVVKTVAREPRVVVLMFDDSGTVSAEVNYETVTRVGGSVVSRAQFKSVDLNWMQITNLVPSLANALVEFKTAAKASLANAP